MSSRAKEKNNEGRENTIVVLVALYRYQNFPIRIMHSLLEDISGITPYTIFFQDYDTSAFDSNAFKALTEIDEDLFIKQIIALNPKLVGISVLSPCIPIAKRLAKLIRDKSSALVVWGGIHPTISPESCIKEADIICVGEGEGAIEDLVTHLRDGTDYLNVENLWINNDGHIIRNPMRPLIQDLDVLPFPAYGNDSFYFIDSKKMTRSDVALLDSNLWIQTSRGCPFVCSYCVNSLLRPLFKHLGHYTRRRSVNSIIREIKEQLNASGNMKTNVFFLDEVFGEDESWLSEFQSIYKKEIGLPFYVEYNPKSIKSTILSKLVDAGVDVINFGIQSGSDFIRNHIFHRPGKNEEIINIAHKIASYGVKIKYDLIIDNPYDTEESLKNAISLLLQLPKPLSFNLYSLQFFPGYPLTRKAIEDGHIKVEDSTPDSLMEKTTLSLVFTPRLLPFNKKRILENIIWLIVWEHTTDRIVKYAVFNDSTSSKLCLICMNFQAIILGKILGVGGIVWTRYVITAVKYVLKGDIKTLYLKCSRVMQRRRTF